MQPLNFAIMIYQCFLTMSADTPDDSQVGLPFRVITPLKPIIYFSSTHPKRLTKCSGCMDECKNC